MDHDQIAAWLRDRRIALGLSQRAVARRAGVSHRSVYAWEAGECAPGLPETVLWSGALGCEVLVRERAE